MTPDTRVIMQIKRQECPAERKPGLLTIEPVAGTIPARVQPSGKIRKNLKKNPRSKKNQNFSGRSRDRLS
jgi:hypothetical protein